jgi:hypothetical protein
MIAPALPSGAFARTLPVLAERQCHARARAASVSFRSVEMRENQATECIFFKKQQVLE